jgi:quercetin dioxygenase-like cupin family protein
VSKASELRKGIAAGERNLVKLFPALEEYCSPKVIGEVNDVYVKITKVVGNDVPWHTHDHEDEMFYMVKGSLYMELRNRPGFTLAEGELFIVPQGIEHRVSCEEECWILLIEPKITKHTGNVESTITRSIGEQTG